MIACSWILMSPSAKEASLPISFWPSWATEATSAGNAVPFPKSENTPARLLISRREDWQAVLFADVSSGFLAVAGEEEADCWLPVPVDGSDPHPLARPTMQSSAGTLAEALTALLATAAL